MNIKIFCKTLEEYKSVISLFTEQKALRFNNTIPKLSDETILFSIKENDNLVVVVIDNHTIYWCENHCDGCNLCEGYKDTNATKFLREHKLERILND